MLLTTGPSELLDWRIRLIKYELNEPNKTYNMWINTGRQINESQLISTY